MGEQSRHTCPCPHPRVQTDQSTDGPWDRTAQTLLRLTLSFVWDQTPRPPRAARRATAQPRQPPRDLIWRRGTWSLESSFCASPLNTNDDLRELALSSRCQPGCPQTTRDAPPPRRPPRALMPAGGGGERKALAGARGASVSDSPWSRARTAADRYGKQARPRTPRAQHAQIEHAAGCGELGKVGISRIRRPALVGDRHRGALSLSRCLAHGPL